MPSKRSLTCLSLIERSSKCGNSQAMTRQFVDGRKGLSHGDIPRKVHIIETHPRAIRFWQSVSRFWPFSPQMIL